MTTSNPGADWLAALAEVRALLIAQARQGATITYGDLSARLTTVSLPPYSYGLSRLLIDLIKQDEAAGRAPLATLVVRKSDGRPGAGYFKYFLARGEDFEDFEAFWQAQFQRVCAEWGG